MPNGVEQKKMQGRNPVIAAAIGAGGSLIASLLNRRQQRRDEAFIRHYNEPKQQIERLKEAGLSPSYMYGAGGQANQANDPAQMDVINPEMMPFLAELALLPAQKRKMEAEANIAEHEAGLKYLEREYMEQWIEGEGLPPWMNGRNRYQLRNLANDMILYDNANLSFINRELQNDPEVLTARKKSIVAQLMKEVEILEGLDIDNKVREQALNDRTFFIEIAKEFGKGQWNPVKIYEGIARAIQLFISSKLK